MDLGRGKFLLFFLSLIFIDQFSKYVIRQNGGFYICNKGVAFGIDFPEFIFWPIWIFLIGLVAHFLFKNKEYIYSLTLIVSGAISNMIDRLYHGCIVDFIDLKIWPVFNLADAFIVIGAIILITQNTKRKTQIKNK